ncbi:hypothetical protein P692DRAFT_20828543 [Suillus brevipes Sb2]|nr:hypothetical protein P692DRAFT_20828543 [Suillus brevipes Sb2]
MGSRYKNKPQLIAARTLPLVDLPIQVSLVLCSQRLLLVPPEPASSPVSPLRLD